MSLTIRCKPNVYPFGVHPRIKYAILVMAQAIHNVCGKECVITSLVDSRHRSDSYHYLGGAVDFRSRHLTHEQQQEALSWARRELGTEFDLILESDHYHLEWDNTRTDGESSRVVLQRRMEAAQQDLVDSILDPASP